MPVSLAFPPVVDWSVSSRIIVLSALISLITGCAAKPAAPEKPGTTFPLKFPVLLVNDRDLRVYDNEDRLTTTTGASSIGYTEYRAIASDGMTYSILNETQFGKRAWFMDLGTTPFHVFLEMKKGGVITLPKAKALVLRTALAPRGPVDGTAHGAEIATQRIQSSQSLPDLIEVCRKTWQWS
jgi:hypothetical protein